jgi:hypothetical protein
MAKPPSLLADRIRAAIAASSSTHEACAANWRVSNGTLYSLLRGKPIGSTRVFRRLQAAGVEVSLADMAEDPPPRRSRRSAA